VIFLAAHIQAVLLVFALVCLAFGGFTALDPRRSIALYVEIMRWFNWRVSPIDETREIKNTRILGTVLFFLGWAILIFPHSQLCPLVIRFQ